jgi:hypothetical protein
MVFSDDLLNQLIYQILVIKKKMFLTVFGFEVAVE